MSRFRRLLRSAVRPAAMVGVVGTLSLSMIVAAPSNAYAFGNGSDLLEKAAPRISGAIKTIAPVAGPVAAVATSVTPVGWALKGGYSLVMLAFSTSDIWIPWLLDAGSSFGQSPADAPATVPAGAAPGPNYFNGLTISGVQFPAPTSARAVNVTISYATNISGNFTVGALLSCKRLDGSIYQTTAFIGLGMSNVKTTTNYAQCNVSGETLMGYRVGAAGAGNGLPGRTTTGTGSYAGPTNIVQGGDLLAASAAFDPRSSSVGYEGKSECIDATGTVSWISGPVVAGSAGGVQMPSCEAAGKGHGTGRTQVVAFKPDGTQQPVWDVPVAPSDPSTPMCDPGKSSGGCVLSVELDGKGCEAGNVECENWAEIQKNDPGNTRLKCRFGPYTLPMSACNMLEQAYRAGGAIATERNTDGDPATQDNNNYAGAPVTQPAGSPVTTGTGGQPVPGGAGQTTPSADDQSKQCFPQGWAALNPVEWVVKPVGCALRAAFIPSTPVVQAQTTRIQAKINTVGFASVANAWTGALQSVGGSNSGCTGPTVNFTWSGVSQALQPFNACSQPMSTVAGVTNAVSSIMIIFCGGLGIMRAISSGFGFNFSFGRGGGSE